MAKLSLTANTLTKLDLAVRGNSDRPSVIEFRTAPTASDAAVVYYAARQEALETIGNGTIGSPATTPSTVWGFFLAGEVKDEDLLRGDEFYFYSTADVEVRYYVKNYVKQ